MNVIANVLLKDYQIKLIPHINTDERDEVEKAMDLTNEEALDLLKRNQLDGTDYQKKIDSYIMLRVDRKFLEKYGHEFSQSGIFGGNFGMSNPGPGGFSPPPVPGAGFSPVGQVRKVRTDMDGRMDDPKFQRNNEHGKLNNDGMQRVSMF